MKGSKGIVTVVTKCAVKIIHKSLGKMSFPAAQAACPWLSEERNVKRCFITGYKYG
jgi:hypothetical protein